MNKANDFDNLLTTSETEVKEYRFDPLSFEEKAQQELQKLYAPDSKYGLTGDKQPEHEHDPYKRAAMFLFQKGYKSLAIDFLADRWEELAGLQDNEHVYRASLSMQLAEFYLELKDEGAALRWLLLTYADDLLHGNGQNKGAGIQKLRATLGMTQQELEKFADIAKDNKNKTEEKGWTIAEGFAEDVALQFVVKNTELIHLFTKTSFVTEFPVSRTYLSKLIKLAEDDPGDTDRQGKQLEYLAAYLIWLIPSWVPLRNIQDSKQTFENDIVVRNYNRNALPSLLGEYFLVECKNKHKTTKQTGTVSSPDVGYFLYRMHLTNCRFGMIFTWEGISGETRTTETRNATRLIERGFDKDASTCIVLKKEDYDDLAKGNSSFLSLLGKLIEEFRFGKQKTSQNSESELQKIKGIGPKQADKLAQIGISTLSHLVDADAEKVVDGSLRITVPTFKKWQEEASKLLTS